ncbi:MAG: hypothetical protein B6A08_15455 [Sorangiineae bacterium NIC37A_2]|nr:MAG: hypothetical protein B6A08_15455 [Sorangiineae bacterium NIC37A_2]
MIELCFAVLFREAMDCLNELSRVVFTSEFGKSPAAGIVVGFVLLILKDLYERRRARTTLKAALCTEAKTTWRVVETLMRGFPTRFETQAVVEAVETKSLTFEVINKLPSGFLFLKPNFPLGDVIAKLRPHEAEAAILYFDVWDRLANREARYSATFHELLKLTPHQQDANYAVQLKEIADELQGGLYLMLIAARDLASARHRLECATTTDTRSVSPDEFQCPGDWTL